MSRADLVFWIMLVLLNVTAVATFFIGRSEGYKQAIKFIRSSQ